MHPAWLAIGSQLEDHGLVPVRDVTRCRNWPNSEIAVAKTLRLNVNASALDSYDRDLIFTTVHSESPILSSSNLVFCYCEARAVPPSRALSGREDIGVRHRLAVPINHEAIEHCRCIHPPSNERC